MNRQTLWRVAPAAVMAVAFLASTPSAYAGSPDLKAPFVCGTTYIGSTYPGHSQGAVDFNEASGNDKGDPVLASAAGRVIDYIAWDGKVVLQHAGGYQTIYAHMTGITVRVGDTVVLGERLGRIGAVGNATGPHLHYQQLISGSPLHVRFDGVPYRMGTPLVSTNCGGAPPPHHKHKHKPRKPQPPDNNQNGENAAALGFR